MLLQCPVGSAAPLPGCLCNLDFLGLVWFGIFINWLPGNCNWHSFGCNDLTLFAAGETLTRAWNSPGRNSKAASWTWTMLLVRALSHLRRPDTLHTWPVRWNVEMKWYALIKNELTQHAANADGDGDVDADAAADVALFCGHCLGWFRFHCSSSLSPCPFALSLSFGLCNWYCLIFMFLLRYCALLLLLLLFFHNFIKSIIHLGICVKPVKKPWRIVKEFWKNSRLWLVERER